MTGFVRTVLGDIDPADLGRVYAHEHLIIDTPLVEDRWPHIHLPSVDDAVAEAEACRLAGVGTMVDAMPAASGRHVERLAEVSRRSGVHVVAATGLHTPKYYTGQAWTTEEPPAELARLFIADVEEGIDRYDYMGPIVRRTGHRAGILKVATAQEGLTERDRRVFEAAALAHAATGVPILTHCEEGRGAHAHLDAFDRLGVPAERIVLSHTDKVDDPAYHRSLLERGAYLEYDQGVRTWDAPGSPTVRLVVAMVEEGFGTRLMLATDGARRSLWSRHGGVPGLAWLAAEMPGHLMARGLTADAVERLFTENPARFLAF